MGWKGYEATLNLGMIFRKMYCHKCGSILNTKKVSNIYKKGDFSYSNDILGHPTIGMDRKEVAYYIYNCQHCGSEITYDEQCIIAKKQKQLKKKILSENE